MRRSLLCIYLFFSCFFLYSQEEIDHEELLDFIRRQTSEEQHNVDYLREVEGLSRHDLQDSLVCGFDRIMSKKQGVLTRQEARRIIRISAALNSRNSKEHYNTLLKLSEIVKDNLVEYSIKIELARLDDNWGVIDEICISEYNKHGLSRVVQIQWMVAYLFGRNLSAANIASVIGEEFCGDNLPQSYIYKRKAKEWIYSVNKYEIIAGMMVEAINKEYSEIKEKLSDKGIETVPMVYRVDISPDAISARESLIELFFNSQTQDIVSAEFFREVGIDYLNKGDQALASLFFKKSIADYEVSYLPSINDKNLLNNTRYLLATIYRNNGKVEDSLNLLENILKEKGNVSTSVNFTEIQALFDLAGIYIEKGKFITAQNMLDSFYDEFENYDRIVFDFIPYYVSFKSLSDFYLYYEMMFDYLRSEISVSINSRQSISLVDSVLEDLQKLSSDNNIYYRCLYNRLLVMEREQKYQQAIDFIKNADLPKEYNSYFEILVNLQLLEARILHSLNKNKSIKAFQKLSDNLGNYVKEKLLTFNDESRLDFVERVHERYKQIEMTVNELYSDTEIPNDLSCMLYNNLLLSKGLMLSSDNIVRDAVYDTADASLIQQYNDVISDKKTTNTIRIPHMKEDHRIDRSSVASFYSIEKFLQDENVSKIKKELDVLNHPRIKERIENNKRLLSCSHKDLCASLSDDDIAIEISSYPYKKKIYSIPTSGTQYNAYILKKGTDPIKIDLFWIRDNAQIEESIANNLWNSLTPYIEGKHSVYISPSGVFNGIPFESSRYVDHSNRTIYRLTSTRELAMNKHKNHNKSHEITLYGGLDYYMTAQELNEENKKYPSISISRDLLLRESMSLEYLSGTLQEVDNILNIASQKADKNGKNIYSIETYTGKSGTELSFKSLSGQNKKVVHIGTHGYFDPDCSSFTETMERTGLVFSGACTVMDIQDESYRVSDGFLSAKEVSELDFRKMDLVSLSACQTGLGLDTNDGIYGLQRGFKKAGVKSIIMTLDKVDDSATCFLMTEFYRNWIGKGLSKQKSLELAQDAVRQTPGWEKPEFWSPFVLLDGIE